MPRYVFVAPARVKVIANHLSFQAKPQTKVDKMFQHKNTTILSEHYQKLRADEGDSNDADNPDAFFGLVRANHDVDDSFGADTVSPITQTV
jgi:hypothetical protein